MPITHDFAAAAPIKPNSNAAVNRDDPLSAGLLHVWAFVDGERKAIPELVGSTPIGPLVNNGADDGAWRRRRMGWQYYSLAGKKAWLNATTSYNAPPMPETIGPWSVLLVFEQGIRSAPFPNVLLDWSNFGSIAIPHVRLQLQSATVEAVVNAGALGTRTVSVPQQLDAGDHVVAVAAQDSRSLRFWLNGHEGQPDALAHQPGSDRLRQLQLNGAKVAAGDPSNPADGQLYLVATWTRALGPQDVSRLMTDPFCLVRPSGWCDPPDLIYRPTVWRRLPCFDFDSRRVLFKPIDQTDPGGAVIFAAKANRITSRRIEIRLNLLDDDELAAVEAAWDGGRGAVDPFYVRLPGEAADSRVVFESDRLTISHDTPAARSARVNLVDVTRHGNP